MKPIVSIFAVQLSMETLVWGQMPGMANHPSQPPDDSNASTSAMNRPRCRAILNFRNDIIIISPRKHALRS
jgi:hypothetical protein